MDREIVGLIVGELEPAGEAVRTVLIVKAPDEEPLVAAEGDARTVITVGVWLTELVTELRGDTVGLIE